MLLVKPSFEILTPLNKDLLKIIELAGRTCYKSEDKITDDSASKFCRMIANRKHESVLEHASVSVRFIIDRGVSHELVRHRLMSPSQECVVGSTKVHKKYTIKELYDRSDTCYGRTHNKTISLKSCDQFNNIVLNKIQHIFYKGRAPVFKIKTRLGYEISATAQHKFMLANGQFVTLDKLCTNMQIMVNGRPSLLQIPDSELIRLYVECKLSPVEIAQQYTVPYRTVVYCLKRIGIFQKRINDKNKEKYQRNHTPQSYEKSRQTNLALFRKGMRTVWNKGLTEKDHPSVKKQADTLRQHHNNGQLPGELNSSWKGGISADYCYSQKSRDGCCELCGKNNKVEIHHKNKNRQDNNITNLIRICINCHSKLHHGWYIGNVAHPDIIESIIYVGIEDVYDLEMSAPYHNYIANGFVVHNSTRYVNYKKRGCTFVIPPWVDIEPGKYDSIIQFQTSEKNTIADDAWFQALLDAEQKYLFLLSQGWQPQQARSVLPNSLKTEIVVTSNLREWKHIFKVRCDKEVHPQMREIMIPVRDEFVKVLPEVFDTV